MNGYGCMGYEAGGMTMYVFMWIGRSSVMGSMPVSLCVEFFFN